MSGLFSEKNLAAIVSMIHQTLYIKDHTHNTAWHENTMADCHTIMRQQPVTHQGQSVASFVAMIRAGVCIESAVCNGLHVCAMDTL